MEDYFDAGPELFRETEILRVLLKFGVKNMHDWNVSVRTYFFQTLSAQSGVVEKKLKDFSQSLKSEFPEEYVI